MRTSLILFLATTTACSTLDQSSTSSQVDLGHEFALCDLDQPEGNLVQFGFNQSRHPEEHETCRDAQNHAIDCPNSMVFFVNDQGEADHEFMGRGSLTTAGTGTIEVYDYAIGEAATWIRGERIGHLNATPGAGVFTFAGELIVGTTYDLSNCQWLPAS